MTSFFIFSRITQVYVVNQHGFEWWSFLLGGFVGSFIAGTTVLLIQRNFENSRKRSNQRLLLKKLKDELTRIADMIPKYMGPDKLHIRDPISIVSMELIQTEDLTAFPKASRAKLADLLLDCYIATEKYNNLVNSYTDAQIGKSLAPDGHKQAYDDLVERHKVLIDIKKELLKLIKS